MKDLKDLKPRESESEEALLLRKIEKLRYLIGEKNDDELKREYYKLEHERKFRPKFARFEEKLILDSRRFSKSD